jgi:hypothetical protein
MRYHGPEHEDPRAIPIRSGEQGKIGLFGPRRVANPFTLNECQPRDLVCLTAGCDAEAVRGDGLRPGRAVDAGESETKYLTL